MHRVPGCGPTPCDIVFCGEKPGEQEAREGEPLVGRTSRDFNKTLLPSLGFSRHDVFLTNLRREYRAKGESYTKEEIAYDLNELREELCEVRPKLVVAIGAEATRYFLGEDADLDEVHGILWQSPTDPWKVFPTGHIAAYTPEAQARVIYDFQQLRIAMYEEVEPRRLYDDPFPSPTYLEVTDPRWFVCLTGTRTIHIDTEGLPGRVWSLQFAVQPGTAYLVRMESRDCMEAFLRWLITERPQVVFHGSLHDFGTMREILLACDLPIDSLYDVVFDDTQIMAYLLQLEPIGLKPNCVRHCGMRMQDYNDVMGDVQTRLAQDYLIKIFDVEQAAYAVRQRQAFDAINATPLLDTNGQPKRRKADGSIRYRKVSKLPDPPKTRLHKAALRVLGSTRPYALWLDQDEDIQVGGYDHAHQDMPEASLDDIPFERALTYASRDADGTCRLYPALDTRVKAMQLSEVYRLELSTYPLLDRMMMVGMKPDLPHFEQLGNKLEGEIARLQRTLVETVGHEGFNANSRDQVSDHLFGELGLPEYKRTSPDGRPSTNDKILEALEHQFGVEYPAIGLIRSYREIYKLKHTFVDRIPDFVKRFPHDGRVHCTLRTTRVVTGRLAASDPNLLAQPEHGEFAADFKDGWVAEDGHVVANWDESQIELRVLAHLSQDNALLRAFREGIDLHAQLAHRIFGVKPADQDKHKHRLPAKAINFGIPMGMQAQGLTLELRKNGLDIDQDDAQRWLDDTNKAYPKVQVYKNAKIAEAKRQGFIRCLSGRVRYIGGIKSWDERLRAEAERFAFSTPIQEGAQWIMKQAEAEVWSILRDLWRRRLYVEPLLQQHDALKFEMEEGLQTEFNMLMQYAMVTAVEHNLSVPLAIDGEWGWCFGPMLDDDKRVRNERGMRGFDAD